MLSNNELKNQEWFAVFEEQNLRGKRVVLVGDTAGAGRATAVLLARRGARVFLAARSHTELKEVLVAIARAGGEGDGEVADLGRPEACRRFFEQAARRLGGIDALVNYLGGETAVSQNNCTQDAIQRMPMGSGGQIINVNLSNAQGQGEQSAQLYAGRHEAAALRRQASELGIRVTLIEPGGEPLDEATPDPVREVLGAEDIARCVVDSLAQPFGVDMILLPGLLL